MNKIFTWLLILVALLSVSQSAVAKRGKNKNFISLAYLSLSYTRMNKMTANEVKPFLDQYRWNGITDVALTQGLFYAGKDGTLLTAWNKEEWPSVFEGKDYKNDPVIEQNKRNVLCCRTVIKEVVRYFKKKRLTYGCV